LRLRRRLNFTDGSGSRTACRQCVRQRLCTTVRRGCISDRRSHILARRQCLKYRIPSARRSFSSRLCNGCCRRSGLLRRFVQTAAALQRCIEGIGERL